MVWRDLHAFYFSTRSGSKTEKQVLIFKGWRKRNHKTKGEAVFLSDLQTSGSEKQRGSCSACAAVSFPNTATRIWSLRRDFQEMQMVLKRKRSRDMPSIMSVKSTKKCQDACDKMGLAPIVNTSIFRKPHNGKANLEKNELCAIFSCRQLGVYGGHGRWENWTHIAKSWVTWCCCWVNTPELTKV